LEELECAFGVNEKILMSRILQNLFGKIWIQNVGDIDFKIISATENSNKFPKNQVLEGIIC
jgi:cysteinyl-tRNA synthetase